MHAPECHIGKMEAVVKVGAHNPVAIHWLLTCLFDTALNGGQKPVDITPAWLQGSKAGQKGHLGAIQLAVVDVCKPATSV